MKVLKKSKYTYLYRKYRRNWKWGIILSLASIPALVLAWQFSNWIILLLGVILAVTGFDYLASARNYLAGIEGEQAVSNALQELDDSYYLINDIMAGRGRGNIDHVLLSHKGIFVIETKNYSGDVRCNADLWRKKGQRRLYEIPSVTKQARNNAAYLGGLIRRKTKLDVPVMPICVFTNPWVQLKVTKPTMPVLRLAELATFVRESKPLTTLSDSQIQSVCKCILGRYYEQGALATE